MTLDIRQRPSPNHEPRAGGRRPDMLILHYTGMEGCERAIDWLCRPESKVSCHYLIDDDGAITQMVAESERAWHAGVSHWQGETDLNSCSIGIEIHNPGYSHGYPDYSEPQMQSVIALSRDIVTRHGIKRRRVLGHSDVAPGRKSDPGHKFDWARLATHGIGLWVPPAPLEQGEQLSLGMAGPQVERLQRQLAALGYGIEPTRVYERATEQAVTALQRHWRQSLVDGRADPSTRKTLARLLAAPDEVEPYSMPGHSIRFRPKDRP